MDAHKLHVKFFAENVEAADVERFIPVFHRWIRDHVLDELMIDVADYSHVHRGPGVVLVGHASDYYVDLGDGRPGILYSRKRQPPEDGQGFKDAFRRALNACRLLEEEPLLQSKPKFKLNEVLIRVADRLLSPNDEASFNTMKAELTTFASWLYEGIDVKVLKTGGPRDLLCARVVADSSPDLATLLARVGGPIQG